jgi:hypothetical protein
MVSLPPNIFGPDDSISFGLFFLNTNSPQTGPTTCVELKKQLASRKLPTLIMPVYILRMLRLVSPVYTEPGGILCR